MLKLNNEKTFKDVCGDTLVVDSFENFHKTKTYMTFECETTTSLTSVILNERNVETLQNFLRSINIDAIDDEYTLTIENKVESETISFSIGSYSAKRQLPYFYIEMNNPTVNCYTLVEFDKSSIKDIYNHLLSF